MAELILKVGNDINPLRYQDGDIICAFNQRRIRQCHAEMICHIKHVPFNSDGLNPADSLPVHWFENTHQYKFQRVSAKEIKRINLLTLEEDIISDVPNAKGEYMNVELFIERRVKHPRHRIFGTTGNEFWFGGLIDTSDTKLSKVWQKIEERTQKREVDHQLWPLTAVERRHFLALPVQDFNEVDRTDYESSEVDNENRVIKKRKHKLEYAAIAALTAHLPDITDKNKEVDVRKTIPVLNSKALIISKLERGVS